MDPVETYLKELRDIRSTGAGVAETSFYPALSNLFNEIGKEGVTMPGTGRIASRPYHPAEREALAESAKARGVTQKATLALLGAETRDVYLNDKAYWKNIPAGVWGYYIGGYQVIKKWLSYREHKLLGRALRAEEARHVTDTSRLLAALLLLQPELDENYRRVKEGTYTWIH